jgi:hypothetical protein
MIFLRVGPSFGLLLQYGLDGPVDGALNTVSAHWPVLASALAVPSEGCSASARSAWNCLIGNAGVRGRVTSLARTMNRNRFHGVDLRSRMVIR